MKCNICHRSIRTKKAYKCKDCNAMFCYGCAEEEDNLCYACVPRLILTDL